MLGEKNGEECENDNTFLSMRAASPYKYCCLIQKTPSVVSRTARCPKRGCLMGGVHCCDLSRTGLTQKLDMQRITSIQFEGSTRSK
jgi:hypothetical protein